MKMKKVLSVVFGLVVVGAIGLQVVPVERSNPPVTMEISAPDHVMQILRKSCYDCHSNETVWPWYAYVAPVSWQVAEDVNHGRRNVNFSEWDQYDADDRQHLIEECAEEASRRKMPLEKYLITHPDAELSDQQIEVLKTWASLATMGEQAGPMPGADD